MSNYSRRLNDVESFSHFFKAIGYPIKNRHIPDFVDAEILTITPYEQTSSSQRFRMPGYVTDEERRELRNQIVNELFTKQRLDDDEKIRLRRGGALPKTAIKKNWQAFFLIGLPASGKSGVAVKIADEYGAIILDSDYAKRKLPEFEGFNFGASLVHKESSNLIFPESSNNDGAEFKTLSHLTFHEGINFVLPTIGQNFESLLDLAGSLKLGSLNYDVHLVLVNLDRKLATHRAIKRFITTKRYVPLGLIFDCYGNEPILNYYYAKKRASGVFKTFGEISTDVPLGTNPKCTDYNNDDSPVKLFL